MSLKIALGLIAAPLVLVSACAPELYKRDGIHPLHKRQHTPTTIEDNRGWTFDQSEEWNTLDENWGYCFNGTQQSPIAFTSFMGYSQRHQPVFNYPDSVIGDYSNWDFGPSFVVDGGSGNTNTDLPSVQFEENGQMETVYFRSWHTHAPAEHTIDGWQPRAEIHLVHYTAEGKPRAVFGFLIDRAEESEGSPFFAQMPASPNFRDNETIADVECNLNLILEEANGFDEFFTYQGSLTTPPCSEGLRWFVSKEVIYMSDIQLQELLGVSTFSARPTQPIWLHNVNA